MGFVLPLAFVIFGYFFGEVVSHSVSVAEPLQLPTVTPKPRRKRKAHKKRKARVFARPIQPPQHALMEQELREQLKLRDQYLQEQVLSTAKLVSKYETRIAQLEDALEAIHMVVSN